MRRLAALTVLLLALSAVPSFAQGCAMCFSSAKGANSKGQKALSRAVLVLLVPPVGMMAVLVSVAFLYRSRAEETATAERPDSEEEFVSND